MKTKLKLKPMLLLGFLVLASISCGVSSAKPASGFDVSAWSPRLLSISPKVSEGKDGQANSEPATRQTEASQPAEHLSIDIQ
ncbi:MAG: hypothetical protein IPJ82_22335 [Lewinellaceae bacterium]|nr:hypothetical protein [Lewinellaceae bacterium]